MAEPVPTRAGFVAIIGAPNVGKSTLLNCLVGTKVSIVSPKVQTTRRRVIGITIRDRCQVMFVDTPGIFAPKRRLETAMVKAASAGIADADLALLLLDVQRGLDANARLALTQLQRERRRAFLVINKLDLVSPDKALPLIAAANEAFPFAETFIISALDGNGCDDLLAAVVKTMPEGPWLFPEDQLSDLSDRALAAEITREQIFHRLHQELPYSITVETEGWAEAPDGSEVRIDQTIYALRPSQKPILIGRKGQQLKAIGEAARHELERILGKRVHLFLFVKIRENWLDDPERYREMGLDFGR
jgi:GTP-binding protein Era